MQGITRFAMTGLLLLGLLVPSWSMMVYVSDQELVATSDLIIVGTVTTVTTLPDLPYWQAGKMTLRIEKVLKGAVKGEQVTVRFPTVPKMPAGMVIMDHGGMVFNEGQQQLFFLVRSQGGYDIVGNSQGVRKADEVTKFTGMVASIPIDIAIAESFGTFIIGQISSCNIKITNNSKETIIIANTYPEGFFLSERMGNTLPLSVVPNTAPGELKLQLEKAVPIGKIVPLDAEVNAVVLQPDIVEIADAIAVQLPPVMPAEPLPPPEIAPGKSTIITVKVRCDTPQGWQFFSDTAIRTAVAVRVKLFVQSVTLNADKQAAGFYMASPWKTTFLGYPLPNLE